MNTKTNLRDWQPGDTVTAADMQALTETIAMLEAAAPGGGGVMQGGGVLRVPDGPVEMPWQVYTDMEDGELILRVAPGEVIVGVRYDATTEVRTATIPTGGEKVQDFEPGATCTIWLELTGTVSLERVSAQGATGDSYTARYQRARLENPVLRVTCKPIDDALRVWALATYDPTHQQRVTQLTWGDLSVMECRGVLDENGDVVWPTDRASAAAWTEESHRGGMAALCALDAAHAKESVTATLSGCIDTDGAVEFFLGPTEEEEVEPDPDPDDPDPDPWTDDPPTPPEPDPDEPDPDDPDDPYTPVNPDPPAPDDPDPPEPDPSQITRVKYGYVAGEGFKSCTLVNNTAGTNLSWKLELDVEYMKKLLSDLKADGEVSFSGGGSSAGVWATVSMSLGDCTATASGVSASGTAGLKFKGTAGESGSATATAKITYTASPTWTPTKTSWILSANSLHEAGTYVKRESGTYTGDPFVEAAKWYRFSIKASALKKHAQNYFKTQLSGISVNDSASSSSSDSTVTGTLSGTILNPSFSLTLS